MKVRKENSNGHLVKLTTISENAFAIAVSVRPMSFLNEKATSRLQTIDKLARFKYMPPDDAARNFACYKGKYIIQKRIIKNAIEAGGWIV